MFKIENFYKKKFPIFLKMKNKKGAFKNRNNKIAKKLLIMIKNQQINKIIKILMTKIQDKEKENYYLKIIKILKIRRKMMILQ